MAEWNRKVDDVYAQTSRRIEQIAKKMRDTPDQYVNSNTLEILRDARSKRESARVMIKKLRLLREEEMHPALRTEDPRLWTELEAREDELVGKIFTRLYRAWIPCQKFERLELIVSGQ